MLQGHSDIPLNDAGLAGARKAARALKDISFDRAFASPLARARKTAEIIASEHAGLKVEVNMDLIEMCFGKCEGLNLHKEELPEEEERLRQQLRRWFQDPEHADPVPGGESVKEVKARCRHFLETVIAPLEDHCERILVVAHGGILRSMEGVIRQEADQEFWDGPIAPNCGAMVCTMEKGKLQIRQLLDLVAMASVF
jgi:broad specificity phosphatase PhoE